MNHRAKVSLVRGLWSALLLRYQDQINVGPRLTPDARTVVDPFVERLRHIDEWNLRWLSLYAYTRAYFVVYA